ncbi:hypothetical protein AVEN_135575-1 [Araneus ventricosus]|uniref:Major facilitator superfamily (MFS) profile domain-containing protein n=1 Tax=Araneus ventricosus TaxID=182803 RepID=A0A4Y2W777_ARAVE|nr:hypothetical protein AVEN_135575-1 [Araneus ventricosus]
MSPVLSLQWFSPTQFGTWWSVLSASANISGGLSPFFTAFLILNYGWRFSLLLAGNAATQCIFVKNAYSSFITRPRWRNGKVSTKGFQVRNPISLKIRRVCGPFAR